MLQATITVQFGINYMAMNSDYNTLYACYVIIYEIKPLRNFTLHLLQ